MYILATVQHKLINVEFVSIFDGGQSCRDILALNFMLVVKIEKLVLKRAFQFFF